MHSKQQLNSTELPWNILSLLWKNKQVPSCPNLRQGIDTLPSHLLFLSVIRRMMVYPRSQWQQRLLQVSCGVIVSRMTVNEFCFVGSNMHTSRHAAPYLTYSNRPADAHSTRISLLTVPKAPVLVHVWYYRFVFLLISHRPSRWLLGIGVTSGCESWVDGSPQRGAIWVETRSPGLSKVKAKIAEYKILSLRRIHAAENLLARMLWPFWKAKN